MMNLQARVTRLERHRRRLRPAPPKSVQQMTEQELLFAAGLPPDASNEEIEALVLAMDWDEIMQRVSHDQAKVKELPQSPR
jgi:hypothetical protein